MGELPIGWSSRRLGEVCVLQGGSAFKTDFQGRSTGEIPFIKQSDMSLAENRRFILSAANWIRADELRTLGARPLPAGAVVFGKIGEGLKRNRFRVLVSPTVVDNNMMGAIPNALVDTQFFPYLIGRVDMGALSEGSALPYLRAEDVEGVVLTLPPFGEQRAIAEVLGALDDKIESNRRIGDTVDALLRTEFQAATHADEHREFVTFGMIAERAGQSVDPRSIDGSVPYIGLEHMPRGSMILNEWGTAEGLGSGKSWFAQGDVLFGRLRPYFKKVGVAPVTGVCSTDILVLRPQEGFSLTLLAATAASDGLIDYASAAASGTKMPRVSWDYLATYKTEVPSASVRGALDAELRPALDLALAAIHETASLVALRDALLPELLSGRLRVPGAEELVEAL